MRAIQCEEFGPIENLKLVEMADPEPGPKEVIIESEAIGVNFPDGLLVQGLYQVKPPTPFVPGMELVGKVCAAGEESGYKVGDRVAAITSVGAFAEKVKAHKNVVMPVPTDADGAELTALMCGYGTAHHALKQRAQLKPGETLAVTGASGLTGLAAVQIGKAMGAKVIAIASTEEKRKICEENGADVTIGYDNLKDDLKAATDGKGADVIFEVVGGDVFHACSRAINWGGRLLVIGFADGDIPQFPVNLALVKGAAVVGVFWGSFVQREPRVYAENMKELFGWYMGGDIEPLVERTFALEDTVAALKHIHDRQAKGKVVLVP
ncbi:MAG: NADPH:quinone oxidoreductase family protein [Rhizobiaceae bacterium]|nr:NADPH:quinone oxidoreductase family protein [Rhizobiaceae bacterium]